MFNLLIRAKTSGTYTDRRLILVGIFSEFLSGSTYLYSVSNQLVKLKFEIIRIIILKIFEKHSQEKMDMMHAYLF